MAVSALQNIALANAQRAMYLRNPLTQTLLARSGLLAGLQPASLQMGLTNQLGGFPGQQLLMAGGLQSVPQAGLDPATAALLNEQARLQLAAQGLFL